MYKKRVAAVLAFVILTLVAGVLVGCKKTKNFTSMDYEELSKEKWNEKEIKYQFFTFEPTDEEKILSYFPCVMNLYSDGSLAIFQFWPFRTPKEGVPYVDETHNIIFEYYGSWTDEKDDGKTVITTKYVGPDKTAISRGALIDDMGGWVTTIYDDGDEKGIFTRSGGTVPPILVKDSQSTNTHAVEWIRFTSDSKVYYKTVSDIYADISTDFQESPEQ